MEHGSNLLQEILLLLVLSFGSVAAFRVIRLPPILGYLLVGAITSKYALGWLPEHGSIEFMGEVGVVFLLFAIGLAGVIIRRNIIVIFMCLEMMLAAASLTRSYCDVPFCRSRRLR